MKLFIFLIFWVPVLAPSTTLPCMYTDKPEQLHNWHIECEPYTIANDEPAVHYDFNTLHQHGNCQEV